MSASTWDGRCPAAHVADPRPCEGQRDAVRVVDQTGASTKACLLHGAVLLASLNRGRVYPLNAANGSAIAVFKRAQGLPAFDFLTGPGVARVTTANEAAVFLSAPELGHAGGDVLASYGVRDDRDDAERHVRDRAAPRGAAWFDVPGVTSAPAENRAHSAWSGPGNARSSRWSETSVSRLRGNA